MAIPENTPVAAILNLQTYLRQLSYDTPGMTQPPVNGVFGFATQRALEEFQASRDLPVTGVADQRTWELLYAGYRASLSANAPRVRMDIFPRTAAGATLEVGSRGFAVMAVQQMLQNLEAQYGTIGAVEITGNFTPETERSVKAFQSCNGFPPTGIVTEAVWDSLAAQYNVRFASSEQR